MVLHIMKYMKFNAFDKWLGCLLLVSAGLLACAPVAAQESGAETKEPKPDTQKQVRLRPGIELQIEVLASGKPEVETCTKRVSDNGAIALPLVGSIRVENMTLSELRKDLTRRYRKYLREPQVMVAFVLNDSPQSVSPFGYITVLGRVNKPGWIKVPPTRKLTVSRAIQQAGGLDSSARENAIKITRPGAGDGKSKQFTVDLESIGSKGDLNADMQLRPGDVVYVPEQIW